MYPDFPGNVEIQKPLPLVSVEWCHALAHVRERLGTLPSSKERVSCFMGISCTEICVGLSNRIGAVSTVREVPVHRASSSPDDSEKEGVESVCWVYRSGPSLAGELLPYSSSQQQLMELNLQEILARKSVSSVCKTTTTTSSSSYGVEGGDRVRDLERYHGPRPRQT
jgi:hypothetical protein